VKAFIAGVIVVLIAVVGLDPALERAVERRASVQASAVLDAPATVDLQGWPVSLRLLFGSIPAVEVHARDVPTGNGVRLERLDATATDVRLRLIDLAEGRVPAQAASGTFTADLDAQAIHRLLAGTGLDVAVRLMDGFVRLETPLATIDVAVAVDEDMLVLTRVRGGRRRFSQVKVALPRLPAGTTVQRATVLDGVLRLEGVFDPNALSQLAASPPVFTVDGEGELRGSH
jgi:hypothetical protein